MSVSTTQPVHRTSDKGSYATNWPAVWGVSGIVVLFIGIIIAKLLWPTPPPEFEQPIIAMRRPAPAPAKPQGSAALIAPQARIELASTDVTASLPLVDLPPIAKMKIVTHEGPPTPVIVEKSANAPRAANAQQARVAKADSAILDTAIDDELRENLEKTAINLDVSAVLGIATKPGQRGSESRAFRQLVSRNPRMYDLALKFPELAGLPFRRGADCEKNREAALKMQELSLAFHTFADRIPPARNSAEVLDYEPVGQLLAFLGTQASVRKPDAVSTVVQMSQPFDEGVRLKLVGALSETKGIEASQALADRALFDLSHEVRAAALRALRNRPADEFRQRLLDGLRYPWPPVADRAAEALVAVDDRGAVAGLTKLVDATDPAAPFKDDKGAWVKRELVSVNHMRNCYLCHAPATSEKDLVRGFVPSADRPLPRAYYGNSSGDFVRADVTYLRQDFSAIQKVPDARPWPEMQRFDYLVRTRAATLTEIAVANLPMAIETRNNGYPQRVAVLKALRGLLEKADSAATDASATRRDEQHGPDLTTTLGREP